MFRLAGQQRQVAAVGPALADERDAAGRRKAVFERRAERGEEAELGVVDAEAVGTDDTEAGLRRYLTQPLLQAPPLGAHLREAGAVDDHHLYPARGARLDGVHHAGRGHGDDSQVDRLGHVFDARERRESLDLGMSGIDGVDPAREAGGAEVSNRTSADAGRVVRGADDGDRRGSQQGVEGSGRGRGGRHGRA